MHDVICDVFENDLKQKFASTSANLVLISHVWREEGPK